MEILIKIDPTKAEEALKLFLEARPMVDGKTTPEEWVQKTLEDYFLQILQDGKRNLVLKQGLMDCSHYLLR